MRLLFEHVGQVRGRADRLREGLELLHELGELDLVERAVAVGHLHARLELAVARVRGDSLPLARLAVEALDEEGLGADAVGAGQVRQHALAGDGSVDAQGGDGVDQRVQAHGAPGGCQAAVGACRGGGQLVVDGRRHFAAQRGLAPQVVVDHHAQAARPPGDAARLPHALGDDADEHEQRQRDQGSGEVQGHRGDVDQAASAMDSAASMSTATMRETPCSCIVTPISCSAISIAILLWLMKRNWVSRLIAVTSLA